MIFRQSGRPCCLFQNEHYKLYFRAHCNGIYFATAPQVAIFFLELDLKLRICFEDYVHSLEYTIEVERMPWLVVSHRVQPRHVSEIPHLQAIAAICNYPPVLRSTSRCADNTGSYIFELSLVPTPRHASARDTEHCQYDC